MGGRSIFACVPYSSDSSPQTSPHFPFTSTRSKKYWQLEYRSYCGDCLAINSTFSLGSKIVMLKAPLMGRTRINDLHAFGWPSGKRDLLQQTERHPAAERF